MTPTLYSHPDAMDSDEPGGSTCYGCSKELEPDEHAYRELFGKIDCVQDHSFVFQKRGGIVLRNWCQNCWNDERGRDKAAHYNVTDGDRLWAILEAANGDLVADLLPMLVGGRGWIRVVDGDVEARHTVHEKGEDGTISVETEPTEGFDVDDFGQHFDDPVDRTRVLLKPVEETPFAECTPPQEGESS